MENQKLIKTARVLDTLARFIKGFAAALGIVAAVLCVLLLIFGEHLIDTANFTLTLGFVELALTDAAAPDVRAIRAAFSLGCAAGCVASLIVWFGARAMHNILEPMKEGKPFAPGVAKQLRNLGWVVLIGGAVDEIIGASATAVTAYVYPLAELFDPAVVAAVRTENSISLQFLWVALAIFLLSYIFRYGQELQQQSDETL